MHAPQTDQLTALVSRRRGPWARLRRLQPARRKTALERVAAHTPLGERPLALLGLTAVSTLGFLVGRRLIRGADWLDEPLTDTEGKSTGDAAEPTAHRRPIMHTEPREPVDSPGLAIRVNAPGGRPAPTAPATGGPLPGSAPKAA